MPIKPKISAKLDREMLNAIEEIVGEPPLPKDESPDDFNELLNRFRLDLAPIDAVEELWLREATHITMDAKRYRCIKRGLLKLQKATAVGRITQQQNFPFDHTNLISEWLRGIAYEHRNFARKMKAAKYDDEVLEAVASTSALPTFECLDQLITRAEDRVRTIFQRIERRRDVARRVAQVTES